MMLVKQSTRHLIHRSLATLNIPSIVLMVGEDAINRVMIERSVKHDLCWVETISVFQADAMLELYRPKCVVIHDNNTRTMIIDLVQMCTDYQIPVIVLTTHETHRTAEEWQHRGAFACLPKPCLTATVLEATVRDAIEKTQGLPPRSHPPTSRDNWRVNVHDSQRKGSDLLILEDDLFLVEALRRHLRVKGYELRSAHTVERAIQQVKMSLPDLILLDIKLSGQDGWWLAEWLQTSTDTARIPFVILTGLLRSEVEDKVQAYGAFACLTKPVATEHLLDTISDALQHST